MGYTNYWVVKEGNSEFDQDTLNSVNKIIAEAKNQGIALDAEDEGSVPVVSDEIIWFNGVGDESHETFVIDLYHTGWNFCKTQGKPYNAVVVALMILLEDRGYLADIGSDGGKKDDEWAAGVALYEKALKG